MMSQQLAQWCQCRQHSNAVVTVYILALAVALHAEFQWLEFVLAYFFISHVCVAVGLHRYFSHNSFQTHVLIHKFLSFVSCFAMLGSPVAYASVHLHHHRHSDTDEDPHTPQLGLWRLIAVAYDFPDKAPVPRRLLKDKFNMWLHRWYNLVIVLVVTVMAVWVPAAGSVFAAIIANLCVIGMFNYISHGTFPGNYRNFDTTDRSHNNWWLAMLSGDYHNNHHHNPGSWCQQQRPWEIDVAGMIIRSIRT
jgi:stearoyl-CoA desaturase (delta-9 desaturase)